MKYFRRLIIGFTVAATLLTQMAPLSYAQAGNTSGAGGTGDISGNGGSLICRNGGRQYLDFLSAVIDYNDFVEYWKDILVRYNANMCLYLDIDSLLQQIEKTRAQIRNAFYTCDPSSTKLVSIYHKLAAELYFLRAYVQVDNGQLLATPDTTISQDFLNNFVTQKGWFSQDDGNTLLQQFISKYQPKTLAPSGQYYACVDPTWGNLILKWNEFKQSFTSGFGVKQALETISDQAKTIGSFSDIFSLDHLKSLLDFKVNGLDPATAWGDIYATLQKNAPTLGANVKGPQAAQPGGVSYNQFLQTATSDDDIHNQEVTRQQDLAQYAELYQNSSSAITNEITSKVQALIGIIQATPTYMSKTQACLKGIIDKTCSG